ncbi:hypothetical protein JKF63_00268 [Porcisia hertigi]|uniref:Centrosomal protein POC5 n=1 Tax=Porcisia hertigi TaxID=2761500 RepID=A0A836HET7_9TRYP|nr:hypothetical protein JKF63_00268 [Porcisia hertigi]
MPLVKAETDEGFVAEVAEEVSTACTRMNSHVSVMIEEYLRRRTQQIRDDAQQALDTVRQQLEGGIADAEAERAAEKERYQKMKARVLQVTVRMQEIHAKHHLTRAFHTWWRCADLRRARRRLAEKVQAHLVRLGLFHVYTQWRVFAATRHQSRLSSHMAHKSDCREQELIGQIEGYQKQLEEERSNNSSLKEKLKEAFVRGMCALNREAANVLHSSKGGQEEDVEAIAEILSHESHSRHHPVTPGHADNAIPSHTHAHSICPVHHVDPRGNYYHPCFAPGYCEYGRRPTPSAAVSSGTLPSASGPSVVRADPQSARSIDSSPLVSLRHQTKPSQTRWRM